MYKLVWYTDSIAFSGNSAMVKAQTVYGALRGREIPLIVVLIYMLVCNWVGLLHPYSSVSDGVCVTGIETFSQLVQEDDTGAVRILISLL